MYLKFRKYGVDLKKLVIFSYEEIYVIAVNTIFMKDGIAF